MRILVCGHLGDPDRLVERHHYSSRKAENLAGAWARQGHRVYLGTSTSRAAVAGVRHLPVADMDDARIASLDAIVWMIEGHFARWLDASAALRALFDRPRVRRGPALALRTCTFRWLERDGWRPARIYEAFDWLFPQTPRIADFFRERCSGDPDRKIHASPMAVPSDLPIAPRPTCYSPDACNVVYMGRLRQAQGRRIPFLTRLARALGPAYRLHVFPGSFSKPPGLLVRALLPGFGATSWRVDAWQAARLLAGVRRNKFAPHEPDNWRWLERALAGPPNLVLHRPVPWGEHWAYLQHADLGLDFPYHVRVEHAGGNAKLLEAMAAGLPIVTERGAANLSVLEDVGGGVILPAGAGVADYAAAVATARERPFDRERMSRETRDRHSWDRRAAELSAVMGGGPRCPTISTMASSTSAGAGRIPSSRSGQ